MTLAAELEAFCRFIDGKLASVDGPYRAISGHMIYRLGIGGRRERWFRSHAKALKLAQAPNARVRAMGYRHVESAGDRAKADA